MSGEYYPLQLDTVDAYSSGLAANAGAQAIVAAAIKDDLDLSSTYAAASVPNLDTTPGADNTAAILAARAAAISRGVPLWLPPGTWKMSDILTGWNGGRVIAYGATLDIQTDHSSTGRGLFATAVDDFEIVGLTLAQSNATARNSVYGMLTFLSSSGTGCSNIRLRGVRVTGGESAVVYAENMTDFEIDGIAGSGTWADGLHLCRGTRRGVVRGARIRNVGDDGISLVAITSESGGAVTWPQMSDITIADFQVDTLPAVGAANASGVAVVGAKDVTVSGGTVKAAKLAGVNIQGGAGIGAPNPDNVTVTAVTVVGTTAGHGFLVGASTDVTLDGVAARGCSDAGVALLGSTRTHVAGSKFRGNGYGAYESTGTDNALSACDLRGNTIGPHQLATATLTGCITA